MLIIDMGSGNTCQNDEKLIAKMLDSLRSLPKKDVVLKWQLFEKSMSNKVLDRTKFHFAFKYAAGMGFQTTASVADKPSLVFLLGYGIPFVKIACRPDLYHLARYVDRPIVMSVSNAMEYVHAKDCGFTPLCCVRQYPAKKNEYLKFGEYLSEGVSDHTVGWDLYKFCSPKVYECHFKMSNSTGPDAGAWARTPEELCTLQF